MADALIAEVLSSKSDKKYKSTNVQKDIDPKFDLGNLLLEDVEPVNLEADLGLEVELLHRNRDNVQYLINQLWTLPTETVEHVVVAKLPPISTRLPREKPLPQPKMETKWEKFAKIKGIEKKRKESRMVWDEVTQTYKPRWGYKRANDNTKDWMIEIPNQKDPYVDYFETRKTAKKERSAKNELQRMRNTAKAQKVTNEAPAGIGMSLGQQNAQQVSRQIAQAKKSTASLGKYTADVKGEKAPKNSGNKRKFQANEDIKNEKTRQLNILSKLSAKKPKIDEHKAIRMHDDAEASNTESRKPKSGKKGKGKKLPKNTPKTLKKMVQGKKSRQANRKNKT